MIEEFKLLKRIVEIDEKINTARYKALNARIDLKEKHTDSNANKYLKYWDEMREHITSRRKVELTLRNKLRGKE